MKIAPLTERWNEGERDWSFVKDPRAEIEQWEKETGFRLPMDYREFMLQYNGGRIYPRMFHTVMAKGPVGPYYSDSDLVCVDPIYSWKYVESIWKGEVYGKGVPPQHIVVAGTAGGIEILMALTAADHGKIFTWVHSTDIWGTDRNTLIVHQAGSFTEFLQSMFDDDNGSDYKAWCVPVYDKVAKEFQLQVRGTE